MDHGDMFADAALLISECCLEMLITRVGHSRFTITSRVPFRDGGIHRGTEFADAARTILECLLEILITSVGHNHIP